MNEDVALRGALANAMEADTCRDSDGAYYLGCLPESMTAAAFESGLRPFSPVPRTLRLIMVRIPT